MKGVNINNILGCLIVSIIMMMAIGISSCGSGQEIRYSHFEHIGDTGLDPMHELVYTPWPADSALARTERYDMELIVRYSTRKPMVSLPMVIERECLDGELRSDTLELHTFDKNGEPLGKGRYGLHELRMALDSNVKLADGYTISLRSLLPAEYSRGLLDIGIIMHPHKPSTVKPLNP